MDDLLRQLAKGINRLHRATACDPDTLRKVEKQLHHVLLELQGIDYPFLHQVCKRIETAVHYYKNLAIRQPGEASGIEPTLQLLSLDDLQQFQQPPVVVNGLLRRGELAIMSGPPKARKTWLTIDLILAAWLGLKWLGQFDCQPQRCLYVDMECHPGTMRQRVEMFRQHDRYNNVQLPSDGLYFASLRSLQVASSPTAAIEALVNTIFDRDIQFVVIDTISAFLPFENENDNAEVNAAMGRLLTAISDAQVTCSVVHHTPKGAGGRDTVDAAAGAGAFARKPDTVMAVRLETPQPENDGELEQTVTYIDFKLRSHGHLDRHRIDWLACSGPGSAHVVPQAVHDPKVYRAPVKANKGKSLTGVVCGSPARPPKKGSALEFDAAVEAD
jgi:hypothetical protein